MPRGLVDRLIRMASVALIFGDPKTAKSTMLRVLGMLIASGEGSFLGRRAATGPVLYVSLDEPDDSVDEHLELIQIEGAPFIIHQDHGGRRLPKTHARFGWVADWAKDVDAVAIIVDTMPKFAGMEDDRLNDFGTMQAVMGRYQALAEQTGAAGVFGASHGESGNGAADSDRQSGNRGGGRFANHHYERC